MLLIIPILLNIHLLPLPVDQNRAPDAKMIETTQIKKTDDIAIFSENFFGKPFKELKFKNHSSTADMAESGLIENGIYFVYDKKGNTLGILKTLPSEDLHDEILFEDEFSALNDLRKLSFTHFHLVEVYGRAQGHLNGEETLFLAEAPADGKTLNQLIKNYGKMTSTNGRETALSDLKMAMDETAIAMAELHQKSPKTRANPEYIRMFSKKPPGPYGIIHGDTHPGNIFYDQSSNKVTFIDFQMTPDLKVGGPIGYDVANFITSVEFLGQYNHIPKEEIERLTASFLTNYRDHGPRLLDQDLAFYQHDIYKRYSRLPKDAITGPDSHQARFINEYCKEQLELV